MLAVSKYDLQRRVIEDPAFSGFWLKDDDGKFLKGGGCGSPDDPGNRYWDFRNASAVAYHTEVVTGFFAKQEGVDAVFFDEGDSLACHYPGTCNRTKTCKSMPNATEWHHGALRAWAGAAKIMADAGKRAIISSQNAFGADFPELYRSRGCFLKEDVALATVGDTPFLRFYEYWLVPGEFSDPSGIYCRNQIANAIEEGRRSNLQIVTGSSSEEPFNTSARLRDLKFNVAGFLMGKKRQGEGNWSSDFFGFNYQKPDKSDTKHKDAYPWCHWTRWGDCDTRWTDVEAVLSQDYGVPMGDAVETSYGVFARQYSRVNITVNCKGHKATYDWAPAEIEGRRSFGPILEA